MSLKNGILALSFKNNSNAEMYKLFNSVVSALSWKFGIGSRDPVSDVGALNDEI
jgi:hypothetical protein